MSGSRQVWRKIWVRLDCSGEWVNERTVTATDIAEDFEGRDVLTFTCPACGRDHRSIRVAGAQPG